MRRTGLNPCEVQRLLSINTEVSNYLKEKHPNDPVVSFYLGGLVEERMHLRFRVPEGVKNIDIDSVELGNGGIVAFMEFGRLSKPTNPTEISVLKTLSKALHVPSFLINFSSDLRFFKVRDLTTEKLIEFSSFDDLTNWRKNLYKEGI